MGLEERKHPLDQAPDWVDQTYGKRIFNALMTLRLFDFLTEEEYLMVAERIDKWVNEKMSVIR